MHQHASTDADGDVSELADEHDLGSCAQRRPGSSPGIPTPEYLRWSLVPLVAIAYFSTPARESAFEVECEMSVLVSYYPLLSGHWYS